MSGDEGFHVMKGGGQEFLAVDVIHGISEVFEE
jgi:hypothetical protein